MIHQPLKLYQFLQKYMIEMIHVRNTWETKQRRHDLFNSLLKANNAKEGDAKEKLPVRILYLKTFTSD